MSPLLFITTQQTGSYNVPINLCHVLLYLFIYYYVIGFELLSLET